MRVRHLVGRGHRQEDGGVVRRDDPNPELAAGAEQFFHLLTEIGQNDASLQGDHVERVQRGRLVADFGFFHIEHQPVFPFALRLAEFHSRMTSWACSTNLLADATRTTTNSLLYVG